MLIAQLDRGSGASWCRVCGGELGSPQWRPAANAEFVACPHCYLAPAYHTDNLSYSAAEWAEEWSMSGDAEQKAARWAQFIAASERVPVEWGAGDLVSIPLRNGAFVLGQIVWVHPRHKRLHLIIETFFRDHPPDARKGPEPDVRVRTTDWLLRQGIWSIVGNEPVIDDFLDMQFIARRSESEEPVLVDPLTMDALDERLIDPRLPSMSEWTSASMLDFALTTETELRAYSRHLFTNTFENALSGAAVWDERHRSVEARRRSVSRLRQPGQPPDAELSTFLFES